MKKRYEYVLVRVNYEKFILMMYLCLICNGLRPNKKRERGPKAMDLKSWLGNLKWAWTGLFNL